eukprot:Gb_31625 [translate_table: standard]
MECVRVSCIKPEVSTQKHRMFLSTIDLKHLPATYMKVLLMYNTANVHDDEFQSMVERLKESLSSALVHFYPLAGRLVWCEDDMRYAIECNDEGIEFIEARTDVSLSRMQDDDNFDPITLYPKLIRMGQMPLCNDCVAPLVSIQVTQFGAGGGLCVGLDVSHVAVDGQSLWHFIASWMELNRRLSISVLPNHDRTLMKVYRSNPTESTSSVNVWKKQANERLEGDALSSYGDLQYKTFYFSHEMVQTIKRLAMQDGKGPFSSFVAFSSHFWRCLTKAKGFADDDTVYIYVPMDCRRRFDPPLPPSYFGNCVHGVFTRTTAGKLFSGGISYGAGLIDEGIKSLRDEDIRDYIERTERGQTPVDKDRVRHFLNGRLTIMTQSSAIDVYKELDFGWGTPVQARSPRAIFSRGVVSIFRGREGGSSVEVSVALPSDQMQRLQSLHLSFVD